MKRFTETAKWNDPWFRRLSPTHKLAYLFLLDACDLAGVVDLDSELAEFQIGAAVDWQMLVDASEGRIEKMPNGKLHITKFVSYQYGEIDPETKSKPQQAVLKAIEKHRVSKGYPKGIHTLQEKEKETDKGKEKEKETEGERFSQIDDTSLRASAESWIEYKAERKESYTPKGFKALVTRCKNLAAEHGPQAVVTAIERAMASGWKGFDHDVGGKQSRGSPATSGPHNAPGSHRYDPSIPVNDEI